MRYIDTEHQAFYERMVKKTGSRNDSYRKALFYTLGLTDETRRHIEEIYDFQERGINFDCLYKPWQTSGTRKVTRLAFNLYNGFCGRLGEEEIDAPELYTPYNLFDTGYRGIFLWLSYCGTALIDLSSNGAACLCGNIFPTWEYVRRWRTKGNMRNRNR